MKTELTALIAVFTITNTPIVFGQLVPPPPDGGIEPDEVIVLYPSPEFGDLQAALDAVPNEGKLIIGPGSFDVPEPLMISRRITIQGAGCRATMAFDRVIRSPQELVAAVKDSRSSDLPYTRLVGSRPTDVVSPDESIGLISFMGRNAGGAVLDLEIVGQDAGIYINDAPLPSDIGGELGADDGQQPDLHISNTCIVGSARGLHAKTNGNVDLSRVIIWAPLWNGVSFSTASGESDRTVSLTLKSTLVYRARNACIYLDGVSSIIRDTPGIGCGPQGAIVALNNTIAVVRSNFVQLGGPGLTLIGSNAYFFDSLIRNAKGHGIWMTRSALQMKDSRILQTTPRQSTALYGDGITALNDSSANLERNLIEDSSRAGIANFGSEIRLIDNILQCAAFELHEEKYPFVMPIYNPRWDDDGGNLCGCPSANNDCVAISVGLQAPEPSGSGE